MMKSGALKPIKTWNYTSESLFYVTNEVDEIHMPMLGFYGTQIAVQWKPNHLAKIMECKNGGVAPDIELVGTFSQGGRVVMRLTANQVHAGSIPVPESNFIILNRGNSNE